jgi:hypothetical protein
MKIISTPKLAWGALATLGLVFTTLLAPATFAQADPTASDASLPTVSVPAIPMGEAAPATVTNETKLSKLVARGTKEISKRVESLNQTKASIQAYKLTDAQKSLLTPLIDTNLTGLSALGDQIKAGTDVTAVKALVQQIYTNFRIYAVFLPQINEARTLYVERNTADNLLNVTLPKIQAKLDALKAKGKDVSARQTAVDNAKSTLPTIENDADTQVTAALGLKPSDYPDTSKTALKAVRSEIRNIRDQLKGVWNSLKANAQPVAPANSPASGANPSESTQNSSASGN